MKKFLNVGKLFFLVMAIGLSSCTNEDKDLDMLADAYVIKKVVNDEINYAIAYYAYANKDLSEVTVTDPGGNVLDLSALTGNAYTFALEPAETDYNTVVPVEDNYLFDVLAKSGETVQIDEFLEFDDLEIPVINNVTYNQTTESVKVTWAEVAGCSGYLTRLINSNGEVIYSGVWVEPDVLESEISLAIGAWYEYATIGNDYTLQVQAFTYESDAIEENMAYSLKEITISEREIVWGE